MMTQFGSRAINRPLIRGLVATLSIALYSSNALGQDLPANRAEADSGGIAEIIVTARKRAENAQRVPITISVETGETLKQKAIRSVLDLAATTPSLHITDSILNPGAGFIYLRGFGSLEDIVGADQPVTVYVDNVFNEGATGLVGQKLYDIDRVEVLKGPQGTLFGRNSTGGAVQIFTKTPSNKFEGEVLAGVGNRGSYRLAGFLNTPFSDKAALRVTGDYSKDGGWMRNTFTGRKAAGKTDAAIRGALQLKPSDRLTILIRAGYNHLKANGAPIHMQYFVPNTGLAVLETALELQGKTFAEGAVINADTLAAANAALNAAVTASPDEHSSTNDFQRINNYRASAEVGYELSDNLRIKSITGYRKLTSSSFFDNDATRFQIIEGAVDRKIREFSQELQLSATLFNGAVDSIFGAYYYNLDGTDAYHSTTLLFLSNRSRSTTIPTLKRNSPALYSQTTVAINSQIHLTGGLRYTWDNQKMRQRGTVYADEQQTIPVACNIPDPTLPCDLTYKHNDSALSWLVSPDWRPSRDIMLYAKAARGFKSGGNQFRITSDPDSALPFKPEFVTEYEAGVKSELFNRHLRINAAFYLDKYSNLQKFVTTRSAGNTFSSRVRNLGSADLKGFELEWEGRPTRELSVGGTVGWTKATVKRFILPPSNVNIADAIVTPFLPKWSYTLYANYQRPTSFGSVALSVNWRWVDDANINGTQLPKGPETFPANIPPSVFTPGVSNRYQIQPAYGLLGGRLAITVDSMDLTASLWGKNLLNKRYLSIENDLVAAGVGYIPSVYGEPRSFGLEISKKF